MEAMATVPSSRSRLLPEDVCGHRVGWFPGSRMLFAEGHPRPDGLAAPADLVPALEDLQQALVDRGIFPPSYRLAPRVRGDGVKMPVLGGTGFGGVRRWDAAIDVEKSSGVGLAILRGVASAEPPARYQVLTHRSKGTRCLETVTWQGARGKVARVYDKGVESGSHRRPGERLRFEDQRRWQKRDRWTLENVAIGGGPAILFRHRFESVRQATKGLIVTSISGAAEKLQERVEAGEIQPGMATKLIGHLVLEREGIELGSRMTRYRHRRLAREVGIVLADGDLEEVEVDLEAELGEVFDT